ncbi:MAG: PD-(D/E)XK nuclease family protein [Elusimicrobiaceae bacterium]
MAKLLDFSYSRMSLYQECPLKFKFRYIHKIPEKPKTYFAFGHSIHAAMEFLYKVDAPPFPSLNDVLMIFERDWHTKSPEEKGYVSSDKEHDDFLHGIKIITSYYEKHKGAFAVPVSVEMFVKLAVDGLNLISVVDRIDDLGGGKISIVDYKTGKTVVKNTGQLNMYQKVLELAPDIKDLLARKTGYKGDIKVARMSFYQLENLKENVFEPASPDEIESFWRNVLNVADCIRAEKFDPAPDEKSCRFCDYKNLCPVFSGAGVEAVRPVQTAAPAPVKVAFAAPESDALTEKVDRYGQLLAQQSALAADIENLKKEILVLMNDKGYFQHYGKKYKIRLKNTEAWTFADRKKVIEYLQETGHLRKALVPTQTTVEKLLTDDSIPDKDREGLKKLGKICPATHIDCSGIED